MESLAYFIPSEEHHCQKCGLEEEGSESFDHEWRTEYISDKPRIVRPIRSEFELEYDSCCNSDSEVDSKNFCPELSDFLPHLTACDEIYRLHSGDDICDTEREWNKNPMESSGQCELRTRPVDETQEFEHREKG